MYLSQEEFLKAALKEDIGRGDLFVRVSKAKDIKGYIIAKSSGIFAGEEYLIAASKLFDIKFNYLVHDGDEFKKGDKLIEFKGNTKEVLSLERTLLNIVLHASSIATLTNAYVKKIEPFGVKLLDTRKTRPLLREFEKYAVRCGGGLNHRMGLDDCLMLKDTHLKTIDNLKTFMNEVRKKIPFTSKVEIECESLGDVKKAFEAGADIVMCDNMKPEQIAEVVAYRDSNYPHILLEASGNVTLDNIEEIAKSGVDAISSGSTIHQANWIDLSMKIEG